MSDYENTRGGGSDDAEHGGLNEEKGTSRRRYPGHRRGRRDDSWWEDRSLPQKILMGIGFGILGAGLFALFGFVTMLLWNWLMPEIFGLTTITYWQSWGLLILSCILFKGLGSGDSGGRSDRKRKRHLRRYMNESQAPDKGSPAEPTEA